MRDECEHGSLRSKCEICERDGLITDLGGLLEEAEGLLRETNHRMKQHKASLLDYCPACRDQVKRNDAFLRGD